MLLRFLSSFFVQRSLKQKKTDGLTIFFALHQYFSATVQRPRPFYQKTHTVKLGYNELGYNELGYNEHSVITNK